MKLYDDKLLPLNLPEGDVHVMREMPLPYPHQALFHLLHTETPWEQPMVNVKGFESLLPRMVAWYGPTEYRFSGVSLPPRPLTPFLESMKLLVEQATGHTFNSVLLNLYRDGNDGIGVHSDSTRILTKPRAIATLSIGASRRLELRHNNGKYSIAIPMYSGTLVLMRGHTQSMWKHGILKVSPQTKPRISLTFREIDVAKVDAINCKGD